MTGDRTAGELPAGAGQSGPSRPRPDRAAADAESTAWALAARDGDAEAAQRFFRATQLDVRRYVTHLSGDPQAVDDLVQDTYLRALRGLRGFEGRSSARTWLLAIARRAVADRLRAGARRPREAGSEDWQAAVEKAQPRGLPGFEEGVALGELLGRLEPRRREAFVLTQQLGLPYAEAADVINCPLGTVRSRVARAREDLIALLDAAEREDGGPASGPAAGPARERPAGRDGRDAGGRPTPGSRPTALSGSAA
ncbi:sigma-70 family RNA polymerase sigma factor [Streptomyces sp. HNM0574]|uniref:sigma-70 family RNA polymerase sigma factor n=1 Tax=Streptomyces sp. HNM0574 TaxID=2714954 RepID=UPI00146C6B83|nr:sigma-70 family RNA polymerase sigma factor [Streptomyces sp. HNM0574]NLU68619.1 sigma-70 family RNA polymerase sigma factor [Streptomyces sp. HNM0574]